MLWLNLTHLPCFLYFSHMVLVIILPALAFLRIPPRGAKLPAIRIYLSIMPGLSLCLFLLSYTPPFKNKAPGCGKQKARNGDFTASFQGLYFIKVCLVPTVLHFSYAFRKSKYRSTATKITLLKDHLSFSANLTNRFFVASFTLTPNFIKFSILSLFLPSRVIIHHKQNLSSFFLK